MRLSHWHATHVVAPSSTSSQFEPLTGWLPATGLASARTPHPELKPTGPFRRFGFIVKAKTPTTSREGA